MNLLFSSINDIFTNYVIDWLIYLDQKYLRYNGVGVNESEFDFSKLSMLYNFGDENDESEINFRSSNLLNKIETIWFRRPYIGVNDLFAPINKEKGIIPLEKLNQALQSHYTILKNFTLTYLQNRCRLVLGSSKILGLNKPEVLMLAKQCGLSIPNTLISKSYSEVKNFYYKNNKKIVCKALHESFWYFPKNKVDGIIQYTALIDDLTNLPKRFAYSLFQEQIEKKYEIRVVYLGGEFFSMAIFSQSHANTSVDFRRTNDDLQLRMVPYKIDSHLKNKLEKLLQNIGLNMASIDFVKSTNGKIYFLEINPVGQYDFVSKSCNYYLDYKIANYLIYGKNYQN